MAVIADDYNAFDSTKVVAVTKPDADYLWYLTVWLTSGPAVTPRFKSSSERDDFYKQLVNAMGA